MKPAAPFGGASDRRQRGVAAVELAIILSATIILMPTVALFARVFFEYSVMKEATRDAAAYMASLPPVAIMDHTERARAIGIAEQLVQDAAAGAGMLNGSTVQVADVECDGHTCGGLVPANFNVEVTFAITADSFTNITGQWTDENQRIWEITANSTIPYAK